MTFLGFIRELRSWGKRSPWNLGGQTHPEKESRRDLLSQSKSPGIPRPWRNFKPEDKCVRAVEWSSWGRHYTLPLCLRLLLQGPSTLSQGRFSNSTTPLFASSILPSPPTGLGKERKEESLWNPSDPSPLEFKRQSSEVPEGKREIQSQVKTETPSAPSLPQLGWKWKNAIM